MGAVHARVPVLGYCLTLCVVAAVVSGLAPALRSSRVDLTSALKEGGRSGTSRGGWLAGTLVVAQFTLALVLVAGATLMVRSLLASQVVNGDMPRQEVMTARVALPRERYNVHGDRVRFFDDVLGRLERLPGVSVAALMSQVPGLGESSRPIEIEGHEIQPGADRPAVRVPAISTGILPDVRQSGSSRAAHSTIVTVPPGTRRSSSRESSRAASGTDRTRSASASGSTTARNRVPGSRSSVCRWTWCRGSRKPVRRPSCSLPYRQAETPGSLLLAVRSPADAAQFSRRDSERRPGR